MILVLALLVVIGLVWLLAELLNSVGPTASWMIILGGAVLVLLFAGWVVSRLAGIRPRLRARKVRDQILAAGEGAG